MTIKEHVGLRIHLYRKQQNLTLEQLAFLLDKSISTVSKYETGKISIDIETLYAISKILHVSIEQLIDYHVDEKRVTQDLATSGFFTQKKKYWMYQYFAPMKKIVECIVEIIPDPVTAADKIVLYYDAHNADDYTDSSFVYRGFISYYDSYATMKLTNAFNAKDEIFIYAKSPLWIRNTTTGLMMSISQTLGNPSVVKVLFSTEKINNQEALKANLDLNNKEVLSALKRTNHLLLLDTWETMI